MKVFHHGCFAMGTRFNCVIPGMDSERGKSLGFEINRLLTGDENMLSPFIATSEVSRINNYACNSYFEVSDQMAEVLDVLDDFWKRTGGAFDAGLLKITRCLEEKQNQQVVFDNVTGWKYIEWNRETREIRFLNNSVGIDVGGFGKGWVLEKIVRLLEGEGVKSAFISFGESSIVAIGTHPGGNCWPVTITHPTTGAELNLELLDAAISVSGLKEVSSAGGTRYKPHVINPFTGEVISSNDVAVVKCCSPVDAEILSTALLTSYVAGLNKLKIGFADALFYFCGKGQNEFKKL